jgi:hypothetical protein
MCNLHRIFWPVENMIVCRETCKYLFKYLHEFFCSFAIAPKLGLELVSRWREVLEIEHKLLVLPFRIYAYNGYAFIAYTQ